MKPEHFPHKLAAVYPDAQSAEAAMNAVTAAVTGDVRVIRIDPHSDNVDSAIEPEADAVRATVAREAVIGGVAGSAAGAATAGLAAAVVPALFISAPVVASLIVLGYGAVIGTTIGAVHGLRLHDNLFADLVKDALKAGYYVLVLNAANESARRQAENVLDATLPEHMAEV